MKRRSNDVHAAQRILRVIEAMNSAPVMSVGAIHTATGLPKPTVVRMLQTLVRIGHVTQVSRHEGYSLTEKILRLTAGFTYADALVSVARPIMDEFTVRQRWQLSISTLDHAKMRVRYHTARISPYGLDVQFLNRHVDMLDSAMGQAYLAYCSPEERETITAQLVARVRGPGARAKKSTEIRRTVAATQSRGYGTVTRHRTVGLRNVGVPIRSIATGHAVAALSVSVFTNVLSETAAVSKYLAQLTDIARRIEQEANAAWNNTLPATTEPAARRKRRAH